MAVETMGDLRCVGSRLQFWDTSCLLSPGNGCPLFAFLDHVGWWRFALWPPSLRMARRSSDAIVDCGLWQYTVVAV